MHRRWMNEIVRFGLKSPVMGGNFTINVAEVAAARRATNPPTAWSAIFIKAIALAGRDWPELRTAYLPYPWPRLYLAPTSTAAVILERQWKGAHAVFIDFVHRPETRPLPLIDYILRDFRRMRIERIGAYRRLIRLARLPWFLRRPLMSLALHWSGRLRAKYCGSFSVQSFATRRGSVMQSTTPLTFSFIHAPVRPNGDVDLQLLMDHRVIDGMQAARIVHAVEAVMKGEILAELRALAAEPPAQAERATLRPGGGTSGSSPIAR